MKYPHTFAALSALAMTALVVVCGTSYAKYLEHRYSRQFGAKSAWDEVGGSALARGALASDDILPVVGSSELLWASSKYQCARFFHEHPRGFSIFELARVAMGTLNQAQMVAGLGAALRGKKIVISYTPTDYELPQTKSQYYAASFSPLHAHQLIFSTLLGLTTKQQAAFEMKRYPRTLARDSLLSFAIQKLIKGGVSGKIAYFTALPLGILTTKLLELDDHVHALRLMYYSKLPRQAPRNRPIASVDWGKNAEKALIAQQMRSSSNPYGIENQIWQNNKRYHSHFTEKAPGSMDAAFLAHVRASQEWDELRILLRVLRELGAKAIFVGRPMNGFLFNQSGISLSAREALYERVRSTITGFGFPVVDFNKFDNDKYFGIDHDGHTSPEGWVYINKVLDGFYHDNVEDAGVEVYR